MSTWGMIMFLSTPVGIADKSGVIMMQSDNNIIFAVLSIIALTIIVIFLIARTTKNNSCANNNKNSDECKECSKLQQKDFIYISSILGICLIVAVSLIFYDSQDAMNLFSFASTLSSIILSI